MFLAPSNRGGVRPPKTTAAKRRAKRMVDGVICAGSMRRCERINRVCVSRGKEQRLRMASRRKARWMRDEEGVGVMGVSRSDILCWCGVPLLGSEKRLFKT